MKKHKLIKLFAALAMLLPLFFSAFGAGSVAEAYTDEAVDITLHKKGFTPNGSVPDPVQNDGTSATPGWDTDQYESAVGLEGVEFTSFNATEAYYKLIEVSTQPTFKEKQAEAVALIQAAAEGKKADFDMQIGGNNYTISMIETGITTTAAGTVKFENYPDKTNNKNSVYLFVETGSPFPTLKPEAPMVVALPIYKEVDGKNVVNRDIHIHPKNDLQEKIGEKEYVTGATITAEGYGTVDIGDVLTYRITLPLTSLMQKVVISDAPSPGLQFVQGTATLNGNAVTPNPSGNGFNLTLEQAALDALRDAGATEIVLEYDVEVTEDALPDTAMDNEAKVSINDGTDISVGEDPDKPEIYTGGKKFLKVDPNTDAVLEGAEFNIVKVDDTGKPTHYLKRENNQPNGDVTWTEITAPMDPEDPSTWADAFVVKSDTNGEFEVTGLEYSEALASGSSYALVEVKAPDGYVELDEPYKFDIVKDGYDNPEGLGTVENIPAGFLPSTGGMGILAFLLAGLALMMGAVIWYKKSKHDVAEV